MTDELNEPLNETVGQEQEQNDGIEDDVEVLEFKTRKTPIYLRKKGSAKLRAATRERVRLHRERQKKAELAAIARKTAQQIWAENLSSLSEDDREKLIALQDHAFPIIGAMVIVAEPRNWTIGVDVAFPDAIFADGEKLVSERGFAHRWIAEDGIPKLFLEEAQTGDGRIRQLVFSSDHEYYNFGLVTRLREDIWGEFLAAAVAWFEAHPNHPDVDWTTAEKCIAEAKRLSIPRWKREEQQQPVEQNVPEQKSYSTQPLSREEEEAAAVRDEVILAEREMKEVQRDIAKSLELNQRKYFD